MRSTDSRPPITARSDRPGWPVLLSILALVVLLAACGGQDDPAATETRLSQDAFIDVVVALRDAELDLRWSLDDDSLAAARFDVLRDSILEAHGVSGGELHAFLSRHMDLEYQDALWDTIAERLKRPRQFETDPAVVPGRDRPPPRSARPDPLGEDGIRRDAPVRR